METEPDTAASESKTQKEAIDLKELKRVDHILMSLQRKVILKFLCHDHPITIEKLALFSCLITPVCFIICGQKTKLCLIHPGVTSCGFFLTTC